MPAVCIACGPPRHGSLQQLCCIAILDVFELLQSCIFRINPHFDLEPDYIIKKPIFQRIRRCNLRREILSTFHTRVDH